VSRARELTQRIGARFGNADRGTTLLEVVVGMTIMSIFMAIFTGSMLLMSNTANNVEATTISSTQVDNAFLRLDRTIRYASVISPIVTPTGSGDWNLEYETETLNGATTTDVCTQLRIHQEQLQQRTWTVVSTGYQNLTSWIPLASDVLNGSASSSSPDQPFSVPAAAAKASSVYQEVTVTLVAGSGTDTSAPTRASMTFEALNSTAKTSTSVCQQVGVNQ
jgi:prepilin-type N-terminal cleavage/methylation domain-containing protein